MCIVVTLIGVLGMVPTGAVVAERLKEKEILKCAKYKGSSQ